MVISASLNGLRGNRASSHQFLPLFFKTEHSVVISASLNGLRGNRASSHQFLPLFFKTEHSVVISASLKGLRGNRASSYQFLQTSFQVFSKLSQEIVPTSPNLQEVLSGVFVKVDHTGRGLNPLPFYIDDSRRVECYFVEWFESTS